MKQKLLSIICLLITAVLLVSVQGCVNAPAASPGISNQPTAQTTEEAEPSPTKKFSSLLSFISRIIIIPACIFWKDYWMKTTLIWIPV